jgi:CRISPR-associated protein Cas5d
MSYFYLKATGRRGMFADPVYGTGGEKTSYHIPTYQALVGMIENVYWKPTFNIVVDAVKVCNPIATESVAVKTRTGKGGYGIHNYCYLKDIQYIVKFSIEWNRQRNDLIQDRNYTKHSAMMNRSIERGGRMNPFLGTSECPANISSASMEFNTCDSVYTETPDIQFGLMFHGFDYPSIVGKTNSDGKPDPQGKNQIIARFFNPVMKNGIIEFPHPQKVEMKKVVKDAKPDNPATVGCV